MVHGRGSASSARRGIWIWLGLLAFVAGVASACDEPVQRAVSPDSVRDLATVVSDENADAAGPDGSEFIDQPVLDRVLPPAERIYFTHGGDIWRAARDGDPAPVTRGEPVVDFSANATGSRIAVLHIDRDSSDDIERVTPSVRLPDGEPLIDLAEIGDAFDIDQLSPIESLAMAPAGDRLATTHRSGAISLVSLDGVVQQLVEPEAGQPGQLAWSSDGRFLTYLDPWLPNEPSALYLLMPERGVRQVLVQPSQEGYGVVEASWIPGTSQVVYIKASGSTIPHGGDLFVVDATTGEQRLLLSSSEIAPVAGAVDLAVSPDGETIAVSGFAPGDEFPVFAGVWLFTLPGGEHHELSIDYAGVVTDLWWLGDQLMFRSIDEPRTALPGTYTGQETFRLLTYDPRTGNLEERYASDESSDESDDEDADDEPDSNSRDSGIIDR